MYTRKLISTAFVAATALVLTACSPSGPPSGGPSSGATASTTGEPGEAQPDNVAVLVVDDFQLVAPAPASGLAGNCAVGANVVGSSGAGDDLVLDSVSHGELVYRTLRDSLGALVTAAGGGAPASTTTLAPALANGDPRTVETFTEWAFPERGADYRLRLVAVDAAGWTTQNVVNGIRDSMADLASEGFKRFVLNLSFVVLPCDPLALLGGGSQQALLDTYLGLVASDPTLLAALADLLGIPASEVNLSTLSSQLSNVDTAVLTDGRLGPLLGCAVDAVYREVEKAQTIGDSPIALQVINDAPWAGLQNSVEEIAGPGAAMVAVGAAGNGIQCGRSRRASFRFPFAPALWDGVVSVSARNPGGGIMPYSNSGEVTLTGDGPAALLAGSHGTSFAAPRLSANEAIYLLRTGRVRCAPGNDRPPLAYVFPADVLAAATTGGALPWKDEDRPAWTAYCSDFFTYSGA